MKADIARRLGAVAASALVGLASVSVLASDELVPMVKESIALTDGSTVYVFTDGKMAIADKFGRPSVKKAGTAVDAKDGRRVTLTSNESARLGQLQQAGHIN